MAGTVAVEEPRRRPYEKSFELLRLFFAILATAVFLLGLKWSPTVILLMIIFLWGVLDIHPLPCITGLLSTVVQVFCLASDLSYPGGLILIVIGTASFVCYVVVLFLWKKVSPGEVDIGCFSAKLQWNILQVTLVIYGNGYMLVSGTYYLPKEWNIKGLFVYLAIFTWGIFFIVLVILRALAFRRNDAQEIAAPPSPPAPPARETA